MNTIFRKLLVLSATLVAMGAQAQGNGGSTGTKEPNDLTATQPSKSKQMSRDEVKAGAMSDSSDSAASHPSGKQRKPMKDGKVSPQAPEKDLAKP